MIGDTIIFQYLVLCLLAMLTLSKVDDYVPGEWLSPTVDGSNVDGKFKTRKGVLVLHKENLQVLRSDVYMFIKCDII